LNEWRYMFSYGLPSNYPDMSYSTNCYAGTNCIDTGLSTTWAGFALQWRQAIKPKNYTTYTTLEFWAMCGSSSCSGLSVGFDDTACSPNTVSVGNVPTSWTLFSVSINTPPLSTCSSFQNVRWNMNPSTRFIIDNVRFLCDGQPCTIIPVHVSWQQEGTFGPTTTGNVTDWVQTVLNDSTVVVTVTPDQSGFGVDAAILGGNQTELANQLVTALQDGTASSLESSTNSHVVAATIFVGLPYHAPAPPPPPPPSSGSSLPVAGIAIGVILGVIIIAGVIVAVVWFKMKHRDSV